MLDRFPRSLLLSACLALALAVTACGNDGGDPSTGADEPDVAADATDGAADAADAAGPDEAEDRCCSAGVCGLGEVCLDGSCHPAPGSAGCYVDGECQDGQACVGATICADCKDATCKPVAGTCTWPEGCCNAHLDCGAGEVCHLGICRAKPSEAGQCWVDSHCNTGETCEDVEGCACNDSGCTETAGHCSLPGACCLVDGECGPNGQCVGSNCVSQLSGDRCYSDEDCAGSARCAGAFVCPCGDDSCLIPTTAGICTSGDTCCIDAGECPPTAVCVDGKSCVNAPGGSQCYLDDHCGPGRSCQGASVCPCGELCPGSDVAGSCKTEMITCASSDGCPGGMRCVFPDEWFCPGEPNPTQGVCVEDVDEGCWMASDCGLGNRCTGEKICTQPGGCSEANHPGTCNVPGEPDQCCDSHLDCEAGTTCRNSNTTTTCPPNNTAVCLPDPKYGEQCWNYLDCGDGDVCNFNWVCACGAPCAKSHMGNCGSPIGQPCKTSIDCGTGYACAKDEECDVNPCFDGSFDCAIGGLCAPHLAGKCWSQFDCGAGNFCAGLQVCPVNTICNEPDLPGECEPLRELGECCDSYFACAPGLRCVSAATKSACVVDVSSVCVQRTDDGVSCFSDDDCDPSRTCEGATLCACGLAGCDALPSPGTCVLKPPP